jgi:hypothetical protein
LLALLGALLPAQQVRSASAAAAASAVTAEDDGQRAELIAALMAGTLVVARDPRQLFDVALDDETAVQVERVRLQVVLQAAEVAAKTPSRRVVTTEARADRVQIDALPAKQWQARLALDRARLAFYSLTPAQRAALLQTHAQRQEAARPRETEADRLARAATAERQRTLAAAQAARSEAQRLVGEEAARLSGLQRDVATLRERLVAERASVSVRRDTVLGWQRRVRDVKTAAATATATGTVQAEADATYDALRHALRSSRDDLDQALQQLDAGGSAVPALGPDPLGDVPSDVPTAPVHELRRSVEQQMREVRAQELALRHDRAAALLDEINALNRERISLLSYLSATKLGGVTGLGAAGWEQARAEARHLLLVLHYHRYAAETWLGTLRGLGPGSVSVWTLVALLVPWTLLVLIFLWWKRRSQQLLDLFDERLAALDRAERLTTPGRARRFVKLIAAIHRPIDWLVLLGATVWLLPQGAQALLEVQLLTQIAGWILAGALIVNLINALAAAGPGGVGYLEPHGAAELRLRSLRLVGRVVVAFVLFLALSDRLVGQGTLYAWVLSSGWLMALPVFLQLVRWWRETVFVRVERVRRKTPFQAWVLANRSGWTSFLAAMLAGVHLFVLGALKVGRNWLAGFDLVRRMHAYLFRRELARLAEHKHHGLLTPLPLDVQALLAPQHASATLVASALDSVLTELLTLHQQRQGGVVAVIGGRGMGRSTLLGRLVAEQPGARLLDALAPDILPTLRVLADVGSDADPSWLLIDNAHALVRPVMGGLRDFDEVLTLARLSSRRTGRLWALAIDAVLWPFLARARDDRPLFDAVLPLPLWGEEQIAALLTQRSQEAALQPTFEDLLDKLPPGADEIDRMEALAAKRTGYYRMVWDYARGNPGMALEVWRASLAAAEDGSVRVRPLQVPDTRVFEALPDTMLFILRAVLQLPQATLETVAQVTHLPHAQVHNAVRFGQTHGYLVERDARIEVPWPWLRAVHVLLERRHLLVQA